MDKLEGWYNSKEWREQTDFNEYELRDVRFARVEDRLKAVIDWIREHEKGLARNACDVGAGDPAPK